MYVLCCRDYWFFKKLTYNKIIYMWGNAQISDNKHSQLTRIIQFYWHSHCHGRSHTCQTQKNRSFVKFLGALGWRCCWRRGNVLSVLFKFLDSYLSRYLTLSKGVGFPSFGTLVILLPRGCWRDMTKFTFFWDTNWAFLLMPNNVYSLNSPISCLKS